MRNNWPLWDIISEADFLKLASFQWDNYKRPLECLHQIEQADEAPPVTTSFQMEGIHEIAKLMRERRPAPMGQR